MTILELIENRNKAWEAAKAFVDTKRDKDGILSAEDAKTYAEMEQKVKNLSAEIERMQAMDAMERETHDMEEAQKRYKAFIAPELRAMLEARFDRSILVDLLMKEYDRLFYDFLKRKHVDFKRLSEMMKSARILEGGKAAA